MSKTKKAIAIVVSETTKCDPNFLKQPYFMTPYPPKNKVPFVVHGLVFADLGSHFCNAIKDSIDQHRVG